ncbi:MAG: GtrA family protein [Oscillospiraceae bacterium]|nr:GtrA family protein [Oscillospiraceae bacterium]
MKRFLKKYFDAKLLKFFLFGLLNNALGAIIIYSLYNLAGFNYWFASATNYVIIGIFSYFVNKKITFKVKADKLMPVRFAFNIACCYLIGYSVAQPVVRLVLENANEWLRDHISIAVGIGLYSVLNYFGQRLFVFRADKQESVDVYEDEVLDEVMDGLDEMFDAGEEEKEETDETPEEK